MSLLHLLNLNTKNGWTDLTTAVEKKETKSGEGGVAEFAKGQLKGKWGNKSKKKNKIEDLCWCNWGEKS